MNMVGVGMKEMVYISDFPQKCQKEKSWKDFIASRIVTLCTKKNHLPISSVFVDLAKSVVHTITRRSVKPPVLIAYGAPKILTSRKRYIGYFLTLRQLQ